MLLTEVKGTAQTLSISIGRKVWRYQRLIGSHHHIA
jgi:hypothetical protein